MLVINAGPNETHRPPFEIDGGVIVPASDVPERVPAILRGLEAVAGIRIEEVELAVLTAVTALHAPEYVDFLQTTCAELKAARRPGFEPVLFPSVFPYRSGHEGRGHKARIGEFCFDTYTPLTGGAFDARGPHGFGGTACRRARRGRRRNAAVYAVGRPPGHHAERARFGGYSFLNGTALAANRLSQLGAGRGAGCGRSSRQRDTAPLLRPGGHPNRLDPRRPGRVVSVLLGLRRRNGNRTRTWSQSQLSVAAGNGRSSVSTSAGIGVGVALSRAAGISGRCSRIRHARG